MFRRTKVCAAALVALGGGLLAAVPAGAQQQQASTPQRIEITGTSIRRVDAETASPVQVGLQVFVFFFFLFFLAAA